MNQSKQLKSFQLQIQFGINNSGIKEGELLKSNQFNVQNIDIDKIKRIGLTTSMSFEYINPLLENFGLFEFFGLQIHIYDQIVQCFPTKNNFVNLNVQTLKNFIISQSFQQNEIYIQNIVQSYQILGTGYLTVLFNFEIEEGQ